VRCGSGGDGRCAATDNSDNYLYMNAPVFDANNKAIGWQAGAAKATGSDTYTLSVYVLCGPAS
jgi:hypothetical protein